MYFSFDFWWWKRSILTKALSNSKVKTDIRIQILKQKKRPGFKKKTAWLLKKIHPSYFNTKEQCAQIPFNIFFYRKWRLLYWFISMAPSKNKPIVRDSSSSRIITSISRLSRLRWCFDLNPWCEPCRVYIYVCVCPSHQWFMIPK